MKSGFVLYESFDQLSFYAPRLEEPEATVKNHYWLSIQKRMGLCDMICSLLEMLQFEVEADKKLTIHSGSPLFSWIDRISIGLMIYNLMRMPGRFPRFHFHMDYLTNSNKQKKKIIVH